MKLIQGALYYKDSGVHLESAREASLALQGTTLVSVEEAIDIGVFHLIVIDAIWIILKVQGSIELSLNCLEGDLVLLAEMP